MAHNLLLVDDEEDVLKILEQLFRHQNYNVLTATSAESAMAIVKKNRLDVVISDYRMPGDDGITFLEKVLRHDPEIITILLTAYAEVNIAIDAINRINLYKFILKPWDNNDLTLTVKRALETRSLVLKNKELTSEIRKHEQLIREIEKTHPGLTDLHTDSQGRIILDDEAD